MIRDIHINAVLNGFEVHVGCVTLVFNDIDEMCEELKLYLKFPDERERVFLSDSINANKLQKQGGIGLGAEPADTAPTPSSRGWATP